MTYIDADAELQQTRPRRGKCAGPPSRPPREPVDGTELLHRRDWRAVNSCLKHRVFNLRRMGALSLYCESTRSRAVELENVEVVGHWVALKGRKKKTS